MREEGRSEGYAWRRVHSLAARTEADTLNGTACVDTDRYMR